VGYVADSDVKISGKGRSNLKLSENGSECKPLSVGAIARQVPSKTVNVITLEDLVAKRTGRGLHPSTSQLNLSRV
jgi:hypothetical protein